MGAFDDLDAAQAFVVVAERLHVGRAADELGISRQAVARRLDQYERQAGATLIDRSHRRVVTLTAVGETVLPMARRLLAAASSHDRELRAVAAGAAGVVRFGVWGGRTPLMEPLVLALEGVHAGWRVDVREHSLLEISRGFAYGRIDCSFTRRPPPHPLHGNLDDRPRRFEGMDGVRIGDWNTGRYVSWRSKWTGPHAEALAGTAWAIARALRRAEVLRRREEHRRALDRSVADLLRDNERRWAGTERLSVSPGATGSRRGR